MLVGHAQAGDRPVVGTAEVRVVVGIADRHVDQGDAQLPQAADQLERLRQVRRGAVVAAHAEPIGIRDRVVHVEPRGHEDPRHGPANPLHRLAQEARPVLQRPAVLAFASVGRQQLRDQVAMAGLHVHAVKAGFGRQPGSLDVHLLQAIEVLVGHQRVVGRQAVLRIEHRAVVGDDRLGDAGRLAVTARMRQLDDGDHLVAEFVAGGLARGGHEPGKGRGAALVEHQLPGVGAGLVQHRRGLEPDQPRAALGIADVAAEAERARRAVRRGIEALHGLHGEAIGDPQAGELQRLPQHGKVFADRQRPPDRSQLPAQGVQVSQMESLVHGS